MMTTESEFHDDMKHCDPIALPEPCEAHNALLDDAWVLVQEARRLLNWNSEGQACSLWSMAAEAFLAKMDA